MTLAELKRHCPGILHVWDPVGFDEWHPMVAVGLGQAIVTAAVDDTLLTSPVGTIYIRDTAIRTLRGMGVGSTYRQLRAAYGRSDIHGGAQECRTTEVTFPSLPGLFFDLDSSSSDCTDPPEASIQDAEVAELILVAPTPTEVARRPGSGPSSVSDSAFIAVTTLSWPRPSLAYRAEKIPKAAHMVPQCTSATPVITGDSLGPVTIGQTLAELRARCSQVLHVWVLAGEGEPAIALRLGDAQILARMTDTLPGSRVRMIELRDSAARTLEGFGVGTRIADLLATHQDLAMISGETCLLFFQRSLPGLTFPLPSEACPRRPKPRRRTRPQDFFPRDSRVTAIWIKGSR